MRVGENSVDYTRALNKLSAPQKTECEPLDLTPPNLCDCDTDLEQTLMCGPFCHNDKTIMSAQQNLSRCI